MLDDFITWRLKTADNNDAWIAAIGVTPPLECPHQSTANSLAIKFPRDRRVLPYPNSQLANQKPKNVKLIGCQFNLRVNEN